MNCNILFAAAIFLVFPSFCLSQNESPITLDSLRLEYHQKLQKYYAPIKGLNTLYEGQLKKLKAAVSAEGDLDKVMAVQKELKSFAEEKPVKAEGFSQLTKIQNIYHNELVKRERVLNKLIVSENNAYLKKLAELGNYLTRVSKLNQALKVREEVVGIQAELRKLSISENNVANTGRPILGLGKTKKGGALVGFGTGSMSDPLESGTAGSYKDFIQIKCWEQDGSADGWVALRAKGTLVTHKDRRASGSSEHIVDFACSKAGGILMLRDDGTINFELCDFNPPEKIAEQLTNVVGIAMGSPDGLDTDEAAIAVLESGELIWWGPGTEKTGAHSPPEEAQTDVSSVVGGHRSFAVIKKNGTLICWNFFSGRDNNVAVPDEYRKLKFKQVAMAEGHTIGLTTDGRVIAWGANRDGQCNVPGDLGNCTEVRAILNSVSVARKADGKWVAWGRDYGGVRDKINKIERFQDVAGKLYPPFKWSYAVWIADD